MIIIGTIDFYILRFGVCFRICIEVSVHYLCCFYKVCWEYVRYVVVLMYILGYNWWRCMSHCCCTVHIYSHCCCKWLPHIVAAHCFHYCALLVCSLWSCLICYSPQDYVNATLYPFGYTSRLVQRCAWLLLQAVVQHSQCSNPPVALQHQDDPDPDWRRFRTHCLEQYPQSCSVDHDPHTVVCIG